MFAVRTPQSNVRSKRHVSEMQRSSWLQDIKKYEETNSETGCGSKGDDTEIA